jgi:hypothetical protein
MRVYEKADFGHHHKPAFSITATVIGSLQESTTGGRCSMASTVAAETVVLYAVEVDRRER